MHRGSPSPIFDVPEFSALRRVKPLPKRRRTTVGADNENGLSMSSRPGIPAIPFFEHMAQQGYTITGHASSLEELVGEGDELVGSLSLEDYYLPPIGSAQRFMADAAGGDAGGNNGNRNTSNTAAAAAALSAVTGAGRNGQMPLQMSDLNSIEFGVHFAAAAAAAAAAGVAIGGLGSLGLGLAGMSLGNQGTDMNGPNADTSSNTGRSGGGGGRSREDDDVRGDGDYMDHLRQPGNTKKRKVPVANLSPRSGGPENTTRDGSPSAGYPEEDGGDFALEGGGGRNLEDDDLQLQFQRERDRERDRERANSPNLHTHLSSPMNPYPPAPYPGQLSMVARKRGKLMAVTLAGLQHKELLKSRKRQLAAVMGALSHGDTLALDQALTGVNYGFRGYGSGALGKANTIAAPEGGGEEAHAQVRTQGLAVRKSKRRTIRLARAMKVMLAMPQRRIRHPDAVPFPQADFEFSCPSGTADRLIATKEEVASLRKRFEVELEKQAAKAAKMAVAAAAAATGHGSVGVNAGGGGTGGDGPGKPAKATGGKGKRERQERDRERAERAQAQMQAQAMKTKEESTVSTSVTTVTPTTNTTAPPSGAGAGDIGVPSTGTASGGGGKPKTGKKKKRSTLANASNPHHLKNYVPSRLPHNGDGGNAGALGAYGGVSPLPIRFLSSEIPPRRKKGQGRKDKENLAEGITPARGTPTLQGGGYHGAPSSIIPLKHPADEWICAFCEYDLFYGSEAAYRKAVRNRKKILKRRRRARERAARAASGKSGVAAHHPPAPPPSEDGDEDEDELYEEQEVVDMQGNGNGQGLKAGRWKGGRGPDG